MDWRNKNPEVEIDTDGVNEQTIEVEWLQKYPTKTFEKKQDVDLGYVDVSGQKTAKELLQEAKETEKQEQPKFEQKEERSEDSDLEQYSDKVQKR